MYGSHMHSIYPVYLKKTRYVHSPYGSGFQLGFCQHSPEVLQEVMQMLQFKVCGNSPVQICEQGFLEPLEYTLAISLH